MRSDDLAPLLAAAPAETIGFRQGVVRSWNSLTAANTVEVGGSLLTDLPTIASSTEVLLMQPGDVVGIQVVGNGATSTMYIIGRITLPGTPQAAEAILSTLGNNIFSASVTANQTRSLTSYGDLATGGPTVSNVPIGSSGRALVLLTSLISVNVGTSDLNGGIMSYEVSGATSRSPSDAESLMLLSTDFALNTWVQTRSTAVSFATGLNPGLHTFTAKYRAINAGVTVAFEHRNLTVVAF